MKSLRNAVQNFNEITLEIVNCLEAENYDSLDELINKRQAIIDGIDNSSCDYEMFRQLCKEYKIVELNSKVNDLMAEKIDIVKTEIKKISLQKNINSNYNINTTVDSIYFNKKI